MSNHWPFTDAHPGFQVLVCPVCANKLIFHAILSQGRRIWQCGRCGNSERLILSTLHGENSLIN